MNADKDLASPARNAFDASAAATVGQNATINQTVDELLPSWAVNETDASSDLLLSL